MTKGYMIHLKFDLWSSQSWFVGEDSLEAEARWAEARRQLPALAAECLNPLQFSQRVVEHFKSFGFDRVHK